MDDYTTKKTTDEIPYGYCHCGCGQKTPIAPRSHKAQGRIKGHPIQFIHGHNGRLYQASLEQRFWAKVDRRSADDCWLWLGSKDRKGYGSATIFPGRFILAHRLSYEINIGPIPDGLLILHRCNNPSCVNPAHLYAGTHHDNNQDTVRAGHATRGELSKMAKLTEQQVKAIRQDYSPYKVTAKALASQYGVSVHTIQGIIQRMTWAHVP